MVVCWPIESFLICFIRTIIIYSHLTLEGDYRVRKVAGASTMCMFVPFLLLLFCFVFGGSN